MVIFNFYYKNTFSYLVQINLFDKRSYLIEIHHQLIIKNGKFIRLFRIFVVNIGKKLSIQVIELVEI